MDITLPHGTYKDCSIKLHKYSNNRPALVIYQGDEVLLKASVNMPDHPIPKNHICIKNWSENEGILKELVRHKIVKAPIYAIPSKYISVFICELLLEETI
jgi:hypothetical protein